MSITDEIKAEAERIMESMKDAPIILSNNLDIGAMPVSKVALDFRFNGAWQDFVAILLNNGYEINCRTNGDEIEITWMDKIERDEAESED